MSKQVKRYDSNGMECGAEYSHMKFVLATEYDALFAEVNELQKDAERYRWLRKQTWDSTDLCVVVRPKEAVKPGHDCPSRDRLDTKIDAAMAYE